MSIRKLSREYEAWLRHHYPHAFNQTRPPLLRGIEFVLRADPTRPGWASDRVVQDTLARWTRDSRYRSNIAAGRYRVDLAGQTSAVSPANRRRAATTVDSPNPTDDGAARGAALATGSHGGAGR
jgi:sRNA-binding protein